MIAEILYLAQAGLGAFIYFTGIGNLAGRSMHILYGVVSVLVIPGIFFYTRGDEQRRVILIYAIGLLFTIGILLRATSTVGAF